MAYFRNNTINLLNLHYGIHSLALSGGGAFFAVFLLKSGVPAPGVLTSLAAILLSRLLLRPSVLPLARRYGLKPLVIAGTIGTGLQYPLLAEVHGVGGPLFILCAVSGLGDTFYWTTYHAYFCVARRPQASRPSDRRTGSLGRHGRNRRAARHWLVFDKSRAELPSMSPCLSWCSRRSPSSGHRE